MMCLEVERRKVGEEERKKVGSIWGQMKKF